MIKTISKKKFQKIKNSMGDGITSNMINDNNNMVMIKTITGKIKNKTECKINIQRMTKKKGNIRNIGIMSIKCTIQRKRNKKQDNKYKNKMN